MNNRTAKAIRRAIKNDIKQFTPYIAGVTKYKETGTHLIATSGLESNGVPEKIAVTDPIKMDICQRLCVKNAKSNYKTIALNGPATVAARISLASPIGA